MVDFEDLLVFAANYRRSGHGTVFWETGDFDYDWRVGFADLLLLADNYNRPANFSADLQTAFAMVPEPASLVIVAVAVPLLAGRHRRSR